MKVLVTGCAGFIGSRTTQLLLAQGHEVVGVDSLNAAYDVHLKEWRLSQLTGQPSFSFHQLDVSEQESITSLFRTGPPIDAVINLAARAGVRQSIEDPWVYYQTNLTGTLNLLELCRQYEVGKFVLASTSSAYGDGERPFREDGPANHPKSPYAASKKAAEVLCYTYHLLYGLDVSIPRYFTVYGPAGRPDMSVFRFIRWIAEGDLLQLFGDGTQERDFTYVDDIALGTIAALQPVGYEVINLGSDHPVPLLTIIGMVEAFLDRPARLEKQPMHPTDVMATWADISKAKKLLRWEPQVSLEDGIHQSVDWYLEHRDWAKQLSLD